MLVISLLKNYFSVAYKFFYLIKVKHIIPFLCWVNTDVTKTIHVTDAIVTR